MTAEVADDGFVARMTAYTYEPIKEDESRQAFGYVVTLIDADERLSPHVRGDLYRWIHQWRLDYGAYGIDVMQEALVLETQGGALQAVAADSGSKTYAQALLEYGAEFLAIYTELDAPQLFQGIKA